MDRVTSRWVEVDECWISTYSRGSHGYAQVGWQDGARVVVTGAHRVAWTAANGVPIPDGMTVDHTCFVRACVNPAHLRLLSRSENSGLHQGPWVPRDYQPPRTSMPVGRSCSRGHELVAGRNGRTYCRECRVIRRNQQRLSPAT
jgi:hypothetical protein